MHVAWYTFYPFLMYIDTAQCILQKPKTNQTNTTKEELGTISGFPFIFLDFSSNDMGLISCEASSRATWDRRYRFWIARELSDECKLQTISLPLSHIIGWVEYRRYKYTNCFFPGYILFGSSTKTSSEEIFSSALSCKSIPPKQKPFIHVYMCSSLHHSCTQEIAASR